MVRARRSARAHRGWGPVGGCARRRADAFESVASPRPRASLACRESGWRSTACRCRGAVPRDQARVGSGRRLRAVGRRRRRSRTRDRSAGGSRSISRRRRPQTRGQSDRAGLDRRSGPDRTARRWTPPARPATPRNHGPLGTRPAHRRAPDRTIAGFASAPPGRRHRHRRRSERPPRSAPGTESWPQAVSRRPSTRAAGRGRPSAHQAPGSRPPSPRRSRACARSQRPGGTGPPSATASRHPRCGSPTDARFWPAATLRGRRSSPTTRTPPTAATSQRTSMSVWPPDRRHQTVPPYAPHWPCTPRPSAATRRTDPTARPPPGPAPPPTASRSSRTAARDQAVPLPRYPTHTTDPRSTRTRRSRLGMHPSSSVPGREKEDMRRGDETITAD